MKTNKIYLETNRMLVKEFDRYVMEYPEFAEKIPDNALVVMQLEADEAFNAWARKTAQGAAEQGSAIVLVTITKMKPVRSRIEDLRCELVA
jgi:hypothetical protein